MATQEQDSPKVSCLMVTSPVAARYQARQRSLADYCRQTHRNKELVLVLDNGTSEDKAAVAKQVGAFGRDDIQVIDPARNRSLGALRNLTRECAAGEIECQWDDDDLYHPLRIEAQLKALLESHAEAVYLQEVMQFFPTERRLYWTNWRATPFKGLFGSLMCLKTARFRYPELGGASQLGEDYAVAVQLRARGNVALLAEAPELYIYVYHGNNASGEEHHRMLVRELAISQRLLRRREERLRLALSIFDFGPGDVIVHGSNGPAFTISPRDPSGD